MRTHRLKFTKLDDGSLLTRTLTNNAGDQVDATINNDGTGLVLIAGRAYRFNWKTLGNAKYKVRKYMLANGVQLLSESRSRTKTTEKVGEGIPSDPELKVSASSTDAIQEAIKRFKESRLGA
jgi:hypothetical protein